MGRLIVLLFSLPWWIYIPASIGVVWLGEQAYEKALETEAEKAAAFEAPMPEAVDMAEFDPERDIHAAGEVHVLGLIDHTRDYELVKSTNGVPTSTRYLYLIFGTDEAGSDVVRAALMLDKGEEARFVDGGMAEEWTLSGTGDHWVYAFNGFSSRSATLSGMASEAIAEQGLTKADDFIYIEPFFDGREAALTPRGLPDQTRQIFWAIAAVVALVGVVKRVMSVRARPARDAEDNADPDTLPGADPTEDDNFAVPPLATGKALTVPEGVSDDTPLGRLARRSALAESRSLASGMTETTYSASTPDPVAADAGAQETLVSARPAAALAYDLDTDPAPAPDPAPAAVSRAAQDRAAGEDRPQSSDAGFYAKLALAMIVVGALAYKPSLISFAAPFVFVGLFWAMIYFGFRKLRHGAKRLKTGDDTPRHNRRPEGAAQTVAVGVGGHHVDLSAPVQSTGQERGVI